MDTKNELKIFEEKVKDIFFYCCRYGVYTFFKGQAPTDNFDGRELNRICFDGFKIAQKKIVAELRLIQTTIKKYQEEIKQARRDKNKPLEDELIKAESLLNYQSDIFKNLADSIAWQLLNGQHYLYRRLYTHETGEKDLNDKSFDFVLDFADKINENPDSMCLVTDITNNIQLGDCLVVDSEGIKISEIKSGETNFKALEVIKKEALNEENYNEAELKKSFDDKFVKQIKRMVSQQAKTDRAAKIIENNQGADPKYPDVTVRIVENDFQIETYHSTLIKLINQLEDKDWAYDCVEAVVHIGVYKNDWRIYGQFSIQQLCNPFPLTDLMSGRGTMICEPIFLKPLTDQQVLDIVLGRIKIYIGIDIEKLIEFANHLGIKASWSSSKELHKLFSNKSYNSKEIFSFENKGIKLNINGQDNFLGQGFLGKIIFDHFLPSTMLLKYQQQTSSENDNTATEEKPS